MQLGDYSPASIARLEREGLIHRSPSGERYKKYYLDEAKATVDAIWTDIPGFGTRTASREQTGYPTQKPEALLDRIVAASSRPGDLVADFTCGSGTTAVACERLGRKWLAVERAARDPDGARAAGVAGRGERRDGAVRRRGACWRGTVASAPFRRARNGPNAVQHYPVLAGRSQHTDSRLKQFVADASAHDEAGNAPYDL